VFFETGIPHAVFAAAMLAKGVVIGRLFPPDDRWARISIRLPAENALARASVRQLVSRPVS
jgi:histidinol-phosphate aminotransferase